MNIDKTAVYLFLTLILLIAVINDLCFRKIPNWLTFPAMVMAIVYHAMARGLEGFLFSVAGVGVGIGLLIIPYLKGGMGAGDPKLMGAVGGVLGPRGVFAAVIVTFLVGGVYAIILLAWHGYLRESLMRYWTIIKSFLYTKNLTYIPPTENEKKPKLCYGVAIALGTFISVIFKIKF